MNDFLEEDSKISEEVFAEMKAKDCAGSNKYFPVISHETADAAKKVLGLATMGDSLKGRILGNIEKIASKLPEIEVEVEDSSSFDTNEDSSHNELNMTDEELASELEKLMTLAVERGISVAQDSADLSEKDQEIAILEAQLDAANEEVEELEEKLSKLKDEAKKVLVEKVIDAKISKGLLEVTEKDAAIEEHFSRTEDSLNDMLTDLTKAKQETKTQSLEIIENPTINDSVNSNEDVNENPESEEKEDVTKISDRRIKRTELFLQANKGKHFSRK